MTLSSGTSAVISCACVNERIHTSSAKLRGRVLFLLQEHELRVEEKSTFFWQITNCPLYRENVKISKQTPPLPGTSEVDDCVQIFLTFTCGACCTDGRQFDVRERRDTCFAAPLFPHCAPHCFVPATSPRTTRCLATFCIGEMSSKARAPWNQGCCPVLSTVR